MLTEVIKVNVLAEKQLTIDCQQPFTLSGDTWAFI